MWQDIEISRWVLENISEPVSWIGSIAKFLSNITSWGQLWIVIMLVLIIRDFIKTKKVNFYFLIALIPIIAGWYFSEHGIKIWVARTRPYQEIPEFQSYLDSLNYPYPSNYSFPSGHTLIAFAGAYTLAKYNKKYLPYAYVLAAAIGFSRIVLGAHFLSDVLAGAAYGTVIAILACLLSDFLTPKLTDLIYKKERSHAS